MLDNEVRPEFEKKYGKDAWKEAIDGINKATMGLSGFEKGLNEFFAGRSTPESIRFAADSFKKKFGEGVYNFTNKEHRVFIGQKMAEYNREKSK
jgi:hypothetical protein